MVIGINASAVAKQKGGASFYIVNIVKALASIDQKSSFYILVNKSGIGQFQDLPSNFKVLPLAPSDVFQRLLWEQTILPFSVCKKLKIKVLFSPNYTAPIVHPGIRSVVTIHDLSFFPLARLYPRSRRLFKHIIHFSVRTSDAVVAVSKFTSQDIVKYIGHYEQKVTVVYNAADNRFSKPVTIEEIKNAKEVYKISGDYILFTGFLEPRKNLERLLLAYASVHNVVSHKLVIAGGKGWWYDNTYNRVMELGLEDKIIFTGYVADEHLPALYSGATLFAFPSLYEGFGIAALESICCGTPVLASNNTALPEVVGNAGIYVDPYNVDQISEALIKVLTSEGCRTEMKIACGLVKKKFSWETAAARTLELLKEF